jgi:hypothetical protein
MTYLHVGLVGTVLLARSRSTYNTMRSCLRPGASCLAHTYVFELPVSMRLSISESQNLDER